MAYTREELDDLNNTNLASQSTIRAVRHREVNTAILDYIDQKSFSWDTFTTGTDDATISGSILTVSSLVNKIIGDITVLSNSPIQLIPFNSGSGEFDFSSLGGISEGVYFSVNHN